MRSQLPAFISEVLDDRPALVGLGAASIAIAAAGLDPHVLDPGARRIQALLAEDPSMELLVSTVAVIEAGFLLVGGAAADLWRSVRLVRAALLGLVVASLGALLVPDLPGLLVFRVLAWASDGIIIPFAVGAVAQLYRGEARGTAIGVLLAVYGAAQFLAPILLGVFGKNGPELVAFGLCAAVAVAAFLVAGRWMPRLPGALPTQRLTIVTTALWAWGVIMVVEGAMQIEVVPVVVGAVLVLVALGAARILHAPREEGVRARTGGAALTAGLVIGFSQAAPMFALPLFFSLIQGVDPFLASVLIAPFAVGLVIAGPTAGLLLGRFPPRSLIVTGVWAIAVADLAFVVLLRPDASYLSLILPFVLVGAGFVISTAVRTAVIFASTPRRLAGTAAALNEASLGVGTRLGITLVVLLEGGALGLGQLEWIRLSLTMAGLFGIVGGAVVFVLMGRHDPVKTMWDLRDERTTP